MEDVDWERWSPEQRATLLFVIRDDQVLLIRKKRGLGDGKVTGPGGRIEPGETPEQCAVRELEEEVGVISSCPSLRGELSFQFVDGLSLHVVVFVTGTFTGALRETEEARPMWVPIDAIPYGDMWADDAIWLPMLLCGRRFAGRFVFEGDRMLDHVVWEPAPPPFAIAADRD